MAPIKATKTYGNRAAAHMTQESRSVIAVNALFAKNIGQRIRDKVVKRRKKKKPQLKIPDLPPRISSYLTDDSFKISSDDPFDKLKKTKFYNQVIVTNAPLKVQWSDSESSKSKITHTTTFHSPIMTRRRRKMSDKPPPKMDTTSEDSSMIKKQITPSQSASEEVISKFGTPIDVSISREKIQPHKVTFNSLSYIKLPKIIENKPVESSLHNSQSCMHCSRLETSFNPIFSKTFIESQAVHSSTPCVILSREKVVTDMISPINPSNTESKLTEKCYEQIRQWDRSFPIDNPDENALFINSNEGVVRMKQKRKCKAMDSSKSEIYESPANFKGFNNDDLHLSNQELNNIVSLGNNYNVTPQLKVQIERLSISDHYQNTPSKSGRLSATPHRLLARQTKPTDFITLRRRLVEKPQFYNSKKLKKSTTDSEVSASSQSQHTISLFTSAKEASPCRSNQEIKSRLSNSSKPPKDWKLRLQPMVYLSPLDFGGFDEADQRKSHQELESFTNSSSIISELIVGLERLPSSTQRKRQIKSKKSTSRPTDGNFIDLRRRFVQKSALQNVHSIGGKTPAPSTPKSVIQNVNSMSSSTPKSAVKKSLVVNLDVFESFQSQHTISMFTSDEESSPCHLNRKSRKLNFSVETKRCAPLMPSRSENTVIDLTDSPSVDRHLIKLENRRRTAKTSLRQDASNWLVTNSITSPSFSGDVGLITHDHSYSRKFSFNDKDEHDYNTLHSPPPTTKTRTTTQHDNLRRQTLCDIIEGSGSSRNSSSQNMASFSNFTGRKTRIIKLKPGKQYRRSLSILKRNSITADVSNKCSNDCTCPRCKFTNRITIRDRSSIQIISSSKSKRKSILQQYADTITSYAPERDHSNQTEDDLEENLSNLSLINNSSQNNASNRRKSSAFLFIEEDLNRNQNVTAREIVLRRCGQTEPLPFEKCYPQEKLRNCQKIGEGVYGEVFLFRNQNDTTSVMKIIPIEGDLIVNGERQKKFDEILTEIVIAMELSNLREQKKNATNAFSEVRKVRCVQGCYPDRLVELWELYDETRGSENDSPLMFPDDQLYIVLELANGGCDLEAFVFSNAKQAFSMFKQTACALAVAENQLSFEHRDLHWGNVLLTPVNKTKTITCRLDGKDVTIDSAGVEIAIIDFTLSRIEFEGVVIYNDLAKDEELFAATGDYQFEIYRLMQKSNENDWQHFEPYSNILWLHYLLDKAVNALRYRSSKKAKVHTEYMKKLMDIKEEVLNYGSVAEFVQSDWF